MRDTCLHKEIRFDAVTGQAKPIREISGKDDTGMSGKKNGSIRNILQGCVVAFGMYSRIPVIHIEWNEDNMRYCMCFFPLIGAVSGLLSVLALWLLGMTGLGSVPVAAVLTVIPVIVTGGIHLDGLLDTSDALSSHRSMEERLQIMKDSHAGAFAIIIGACYLILQFAFYTEVDLHDMILVGTGFILSRAYSGLAMVIYPKAKNSGLLRAFSDAAVGSRVAVTMVFYALAASAALVLIDPKKGSLEAIIALAVFFWYRFFAVRKFGGITGDTEGFFLQICELAMLIAVVVR